MTECPSQLLDNLTDSANPETYKKYFKARNCSEIRRLMAIHARKKIQRSVEKCDNPSRLELPSYSEKQAFESGYRAALREQLDILER
jgi:hypothetical protein